jgi:hypothetical protein
MEVVVGASNALNDRLSAGVAAAVANAVVDVAATFIGDGPHGLLAYFQRLKDDDEFSFGGDDDE